MKSYPEIGGKWKHKKINPETCKWYRPQDRVVRGKGKIVRVLNMCGYFLDKKNLTKGEKQHEQLCEKSRCPLLT